MNLPAQIPAASTGLSQPRQAPLWSLLASEIKRDEVLLRASALAYSTFASMVPVFAIVLAILTIPAFNDTRERVIDQLAAALVPTSGDSGTWIMGGEDDAADSSRVTTEQWKDTFRKEIVPLAERAGTVSVFGFIMLVVTVGFLFRNVERAFNVIWRAGSQRSVFMRIAIATGLIFWGPVLLAVSVSFTEKLNASPVLGSFLLPVLLTTLAFMGFYMLMPHAKVPARCAFLGGLAAAIGWEAAKHLFLFYVSHVVNYNRVYGSLGLIPMMFLWVYLNWVLVLAGAELAYCLQFKSALLEQWRAEHLPEAGGKSECAPGVPPLVLLAVAVEIAQRFQTPGEGGVRASHLAQALEITPEMAEAAAERLVAARILARAEASGRTGNEESAYLPAADLRVCKVSALLNASHGLADAPGRGASCDRARLLLQQVAEAQESRLQTLTLADLAAGALRQFPNPKPPTQNPIPPCRS